MAAFCTSSACEGIGVGVWGFGAHEFMSCFSVILREEESLDDAKS